MKHFKKGRKFGRERNQRKALLKSLISNLILKERIKTTEAKAKEISGITEKLITKAKKNNLVVRKDIGRQFSQKVIKKLIDEIAERYASGEKERKGGYTRIVKLGPRKFDGSEMAIIEIIK